ncbi:MAG: Asp-tRNA(Asn)/Glu-tRNA(Gln) amidotransferase subunit GatA [Myxococcota bacterium]|nr:Asp-tRNA(Asn)/Glu-tRNA(Gln) amidotransferase subunit GatA [Myxococcales bacterium]
MAGDLDTVAAQRDALAAKRVSSRELVERALARAEALRGLSLVVGTRAERALAEADASDARRAGGGARGPLDGIPILLKDNMVVEGEPVTCGSRILEGFVAPYQGGVAGRLADAGAVAIGRTNMDEFAMGSSTEHSIYGAARSPWDATRSCGGSSGGSAGAVAAGITAFALGSDTGGSIRQPASFCGVVGMKPTYGRVSRWGLVAFASSLDQIGPFTHTARDCALVLEAICGHDARDSTSLPEPAPALERELTGDVSGMVVGLPREYFEQEGADARVLERVREAVALLERAGAKTREVSLPHTRYGIAAYYLIATAEASSNLARYDGVRYGRRAPHYDGLGDMIRRTRSEGFGAEVKRRILLGTYVLSAGYYDAYYRKAQQVRTLLRRDFEQAFAGCDVIATPTAPEVAFPLGAKSADPLAMYLSDVYTVATSLAGIPGVSIPCGEVDGLPVGLQLVGPALGEASLLRVADAYQRRTDHHERRPAPLAGAAS